MALNFPDTPALNDSFTSGGKTWVYNGTSWVLVGVPTAIPNDSITASMLTDMGASSGDYMQWNGTEWVAVSSDSLSNSQNAAIITMSIGA